MDVESWLASGERMRIELRSGSYDIFVRVAGSGRWLTLLHAFPTSSWDWSRVTPLLEPRFRLLAFDFLGFGESEKPHAHEYSIAEQADLVERLWRRFGVERTGVVAHDYGATVAQELLARRTGVPDCVVLLNAGLYVDLARPLLVQRLLARPLVGPLLARAVSERTFARSMSTVSQISDGDLRQQWQLLNRRSGARVVPRLLRYMAERREHAARWEGALERTNVPLHLVWGMADPRSGAHIAEHVKRRIPSSRLVALADVGHYPQLETPARVARAIEAALA